MLVCIAKTCDFLLICMPNTCQKVYLNFIVLNNALIRNFIWVFCKNVILLHIASVHVSDDLFHNFHDSFRTK